jgi:hypothetical protein
MGRLRAFIKRLSRPKKKSDAITEFKEFIEEKCSGPLPSFEELAGGMECEPGKPPRRSFDGPFV